MRRSPSQSLDPGRGEPERMGPEEARWGRGEEETLKFQERPTSRQVEVFAPLHAKKIARTHRESKRNSVII